MALEDLERPRPHRLEQRTRLWQQRVSAQPEVLVSKTGDTASEGLKRRFENSPDLRRSYRGGASRSKVNAP
jgi:hypothetical protein